MKRFCQMFLLIGLFLPAAACLGAQEGITPSPTPSGGILQDASAPLGPQQVWDLDRGMAMPFPSGDKPLHLLMLNGNGFFEAIAEEGVARGGGDFSAPNLFSADLGSSLGGCQYLNLDVTLTSDLWLSPRTGTPQLFQVGGTRADGSPFVDARYPNSTPLMGLTLSDTLALDAGDKSCLKLFAAPRGGSTDGPVAYLQRLTGRVNPDAPLGQRVGQDAGFLSSSVLGESLKLGGFHLEASVFHGAQPDPVQVDLPLGTPDSYAFRLAQEFSPHAMVMASYAYVGSPEPGVHDSERYSASLYTHSPMGGGWAYHNTLIYGGVTHLDNADYLSSFLEEGALTGPKTAVFARVEVLQRTPNEVQVPGLPDPNRGRWVTAVTVGYSRQLIAWDGWEIRAGASATNDVAPAEYSDAYQGNPFSYKFFFQLGGSQVHFW